jgi:SNF2 family DNA or RNA helicase
MSEGRAVPKKTLQPHQIEGVAFLVERRVALLADEMGLGKTAQVLVASERLVERGTVSKCLIIIPQYLGTNWEREVRLFARNSPFILVRGTRSEREDAWKMAWPRIFLAGYETVLADFDLLKHRHWDLLIVDEIQRLKNISTASHDAIALIPALRRWGMTGTPVENRFDDLTAMFSVLAPNIVTSVFLEKPEEARRRLLKDVLRRKLADLIDLPELVEETIYVDLTSEQRSAYDDVLRRGSSASGAPARGSTGRQELRASGALSTQSALLKIASIDPISNRSSKLDYLKTHLPELIDSEKVLIFSCFPNKVLRRIEPELLEYNHVFLDGSQSIKERDQAVDKFQNDSETRLALVSLKAGGTGLNLTAASRVFHFDSWWTASSKQQANARAYRMGQTRKVLAVSLVAANTIEESLMKLLRDKARLAEIVLSKSSLSDAEVETQLLTEV